MPEGPEVRTIANQISDRLTSSPSRLVSVDMLSGRYTRHGPPADHGDFLKSLQLHPESSVIKAWKCRGKFQYAVLEDEERSVWVTLGMSGRFSFDEDLDHRHARVNFVLEDVATKELRNLVFIDARNFGTVRFSLDGQELEQKLKTLGPDLLDSSDLTDSVFIQIARKSISAAKKPLNVCNFLMNQKKISGVGNYILAEGLYKSNIDPWCTLDELSDDQLVTLINHLRTTAQTSLTAQGLTRNKGGSYRSLSGGVGKFEFELECYGRAETPKGERVLKVVDGPHKRAIHFVKSQVEPSRWPEVSDMLNPK
ncbi:hypothetical protein TrST_g3604 [Triparma strigata]|uniref:Formamidopyrimidine-DNA glycosylase catalytic domain-containing protein n=1 Tax=Triparma strigata TaxID=1606541 RepID=A0A9W7EP30_9STRA|nr:hypothetical protein TrST_g3604 [Triparma strigata]